MSNIISLSWSIRDLLFVCASDHHEVFELVFNPKREWSLLNMSEAMFPLLHSNITEKFIICEWTNTVYWDSLTAMRNILLLCCEVFSKCLCLLDVSSVYIKRFNRLIWKQTSFVKYTNAFFCKVKVKHPVDNKKYHVFDCRGLCKKWYESEWHCFMRNKKINKYPIMR